MALLEINNVSKSFGKKKILEGLNFTLKKGEIVGLIGKSGVGKSVLIKLLIGFLKPDKGTIKFNSKTKWPVGFSMQNNSLYDYLTVRQNLKYFAQIYKTPKKQYKQRINILIKQLNLKEFENVLGINLSGGTKKRVDIACALLNDPEILILDEPFLGLDPYLVDSLSKFIISLAKSGKCILFSSHRIRQLSNLCSKLVLIKDKKIYKINKNQLKEIYD
jgi:ABC-2 type transport system ATP-binding protein